MSINKGSCPITEVPEAFGICKSGSFERTVFEEEEFSFVVPEEDLPEEQAVRGNKCIIIHKNDKKEKEGVDGLKKNC